MKRWQVEDILQALAVRLEQDRERAVAAGHRHQVGRSLTHLPQRRARVTAATREKQGARSVFAEVRGEERRATQLVHHQVFGAVRIWKKQLVDRAFLQAFGQPQGNPVVGPDGVQVNPQTLAHGPADGQRPGCVYPAAKRSEHAHAPVAELVAETLDHDGAVAGHGAGNGLLLRQVREQVARGQRIQIVVLGQHADRELLVQAGHAAAEFAQRATQLDGAPGRVTVPERGLARLARSR